MKQKEYELTGAALKWIAIITMLIDHIGAALVEPWICGEFGNYPDRIFGVKAWTFLKVMRGVGRLAFPIFIFLLIEGFIYTRSRTRYVLRLGLFCLLSEVPFDLAFNPYELNGYKNFFTFKNMDISYSHQNVFFTLLIGFLTVWLINTIINASDKKKTMPLWKKLLEVILLAAVIIGGCLLAGAIHTDYGSMGVLAIVMCYVTKKRIGSYTPMMLAPVLILCVMSISELPALFDIELARLYRGTKGKIRCKYFFYVFYPAHLLVLGLIRHFLSVYM